MALGMAVLSALCACGDDHEMAPPPATGDAGPRLDANLDASGFDAAPMDAAEPLDAEGLDAPMPDAPIDAGPCTTADDCDDGLACTGEETCMEGWCMPGVPTVCDDGIACTADSCVEPTGECTAVPDHDACGTDEMCVTAGARGCIEPCASSTAYCELALPQCGCPSSEACYATPTGRSCLPPGSLGPGAACAMVSQCMTGTGCRQLSATVKLCSRYCKTDADCMGSGLCVIPADGDTMQCSRVCDPIMQTECVAGAACTLRTDAADRDYTDCQARTGTFGQGAACMLDAQCLAGYECEPSTAGGELACHRVCTASSSCPAGTACDLVDPYASVGGVDYGLCR